MGTDGEVVESVTPDAPDAAVETKLLGAAARVSALLFVSAKPVTVEVLARSAKLSVQRIETALGELQEMFQDDMHGFSLHEVAGGWQFRSSRDAAPYVRELVRPRGRRLSRAGAETLAVIAYKQPVPRSEIEAVRGVDALPTLKTLLDAKLIRVVGRQDSPGQPALYGTTTRFLEKFGLNDLCDLPSVREIEQLLEEPGETPEEDDLFFDESENVETVEESKGDTPDTQDLAS